MTIAWDAAWVSAGVVALAEVGDKTQLLALVLAARYRRPVPVILGILAATLLNHGAAAGLGYALASLVALPAFQVAVGVGFLAMAGWALLPDRPDPYATRRSLGSVFATTLVAFFLVEIGDKTQVATTLLAARFHDIAWVTLGTTAGMMAANVPAVLLGGAVCRAVPLRIVRIAAAVLFAALGAWVLVAALA